MSLSLLRTEQGVCRAEGGRGWGKGVGKGVGERGGERGGGKGGGECSAVRLCEALYARHSIVLHSSVRITNAAHVSITTSPNIYICEYFKILIFSLQNIFYKKLNNSEKLSELNLE